MHQLKEPDTHHLATAQGWLELGNHIEANEELEKITAALRAHPDVLQVRWGIYAAAKKWQVCLDIAQAITISAPRRSFGWVHRSFALHELKRTLEAYDLLLPLADKFPKEWVLPYNLACYACKLGRLEEARSWLGKAFALGDPKELKLKALNDADLELLWTGF
ncbi:hypothetical protein [Pedosphaera parvula]|uniref:Tetratricopeptide repeat protein n=1 Tax=Pedosphaera parvula (strain Ellin514) TaxID=320771 RepID=B9XA28_PEDPL|nr:hypothetical protein [Pedosphaera parvula]EEF63369.1 hypothetical protein Cflav_PD6004 [Pedosphaera parvula Ellin514]